MITIADFAENWIGAGNNYRKSDWYSVWQGIRKWDLFGERNENIHRAQRKLVSQVYSLSNMKRLEPYVNSAVVIFVDKLIAQSHAPIIMNKWTQLFAFGELFSSSLEYIAYLNV